MKLIINEKPDFVIHCGDLFHNYKPNPGALKLAIDILKKLKDCNIPFYVIRGNHDASKAQAKRFGGTILKLLHEMGYLIYVQDELININNDVTFTGIGEYGKFTGDIIEEVLRNNPINPQKFNILALHGYIQGQVGDSQYDFTGYQISNIGYNYIALGHYHKRWEEKQNNIYCPGSTEQTSINDWGEPEEDGFFRKSGFYSVSIISSNEKNSWNTKVKWTSFDVRPKGHFTLKFDKNSSIEEINFKADKFIQQKDLDGAIIRFDFKGELPLGKQSLVNLATLPALKKMNALYAICNQDFSKKNITQTSVVMSSKEALTELYRKDYGFDSKTADKFVELTNETVKIIGQKNYSSEEAEEIQMIYSLISDYSEQLNNLRENNDEKNPSKKKNSQMKESKIKQITIPIIKKESETSKQVNLSDYIIEKENEE